MWPLFLARAGIALCGRSTRPIAQCRPCSSLWATTRTYSTPSRPASCLPPPPRGLREAGCRTCWTRAQTSRSSVLFGARWSGSACGSPAPSRSGSSRCASHRSPGACGLASQRSCSPRRPHRCTFGSSCVASPCLCAAIAAPRRSRACSSICCSTSRPASTLRPIGRRCATCTAKRSIFLSSTRRGAWATVPMRAPGHFSASATGWGLPMRTTCAYGHVPVAWVTTGCSADYCRWTRPPTVAFRTYGRCRASARTSLLTATRRSRHWPVLFRA